MVVRRIRSTLTVGSIPTSPPQAWGHMASAFHGRVSSWWREWTVGVRGGFLVISTISRGLWVRRGGGSGSSFGQIATLEVETSVRAMP